MYLVANLVTYYAMKDRAAQFGMIGESLAKNEIVLQGGLNSLEICKRHGVPVAYGGTTIRAGGTLTGKRLAALIRLRDLARRVLQSKNEGWPESG